METKWKFKFRALIIGAALIASLLPASAPVSGSGQPRPEPRTVVITLLGGQQIGGQQKSEKGSLTMSFEGTTVVAFDFKDTNDRQSTLRRINREHPAEVNCDVSGAECGSVALSGGTKIGACICGKTSRVGEPIRPTAIKTILLPPFADTDTTCWENKEQLLSVCTKFGSKPPTTTQTREHILLARQVGVPSL
jgi:hypothetical protein